MTFKSIKTCFDPIQPPPGGFFVSKSNPVAAGFFLALF